ncbi:MAG: hypothetical protein A3E64_02585 [Candidatus Harrisonbacteria bacterium RIFCSPHIGHO2_12_FULL_48_16]|uniref:Uncharacterized protein n=1 Tax=Candidatus Harrisonbacteria bacterium RIFCSPHIGHO2_12_FULL_48_16 TaxID=1798405 RepID=A0A1G1ZIP5_9BACT|nr:MAG: hypothetical protein A3E64_02585 [Candidatus Harrisonbacteria bacterium RIFCSPHIGHO2_12_FULL_48_16]
MSKYPFSTIDKRNFACLPAGRASMPRREGASIDLMLSPSNEGSEQNFLTEGGPILNDFFVVPPRNRVYSFVVPPRNRRKNRGLQLGKEGI